MKRLCKKLQSRRGESMTEAMAAMLLLSFAVLLFSGMVIQAGKLMDRSAQNMNDYYAGQNALQARSVSSEGGKTAAVSVKDAKAAIETDGTSFSGLTPAMRADNAGDNEISVKLYRQSLNWNRAESSASSAATENANVLFTYDLADSKD